MVIPELNEFDCIKKRFFIENCIINSFLVRKDVLLSLIVQSLPVDYFGIYENYNGSVCSMFDKNTDR